MKLASNQITITINHHKNASRYTLMHQDTPLIDINEENNIFDIHQNNKDLLPYALKKTNLSYENFYTWAERRVLSVNGRREKFLLNACNLPQDDKFAVAKACKCLSVEDCFWLKESDSETWNNMNLRNNPISREISQITLNSQFINIPNNIQTPELTTKGRSPKAWVQETDGLYLYKKSTNHFESEKEVLASDILKALSIPHVEYILTEPGMCKCKCMTDEQYSRLSFEEYQIYCKNNVMNPLDVVSTKFHKPFCQMIMADYILANAEQHPKNWGFFVDNQTGEITGFHPLFNHNHAFDKIFRDSVSYTQASWFDYQELIKHAIHSYAFDLSGIQKIPETRFTELGIDYESMIKRISEIKN